MGFGGVVGVVEHIVRGGSVGRNGVDGGGNDEEVGVWMVCKVQGVVGFEERLGCVRW